MKSNEPGMQTNSWQQMKHAKLQSHQLLGFKTKALIAPRFSMRGIHIFAAVYSSQLQLTATTNRTFALTEKFCFSL